MRRREFLVAAAGAAGLASATKVWAQGPKLDRVAVMSQNFDRILKTGAGPAPDAARTLDFLDFPQAIADRFNVHRLELQHAQFVSTEAAYLKDLRDRLAKARSQIVQINLEFQASNVSAGGFSARAQAIDLAKQWIDHAESLGCPRVMVNQGSLSAEVRQNAIDALKIIGEYGKAHKVAVTVSNRDDGVPPPPPPPPPAPPPQAVAGAAGAVAPGRGRAGGGGGGQAPPPAPPATWQAVVDAIKAAGIAATPDIGNFPNETERAAGLRALIPLSGGIIHCPDDSAKYSLAGALKIVKDARYTGIYSIETSSNNAVDPYAATKSVLDEVLKNI
jgi:hypothetical protein